MAYIPKNEIEQRQLLNNAGTLLSSGTGTSGNTVAPDKAGKYNAAGSSAMALKQGTGGLGNQYTNFQDMIEANQGATENQAAGIAQTIGISDAEKAFQEAQGKVGEAAGRGVSTLDEDFLNQYVNTPFDVDASKYSNLANIIGGTGYQGPTTPNSFYDTAGTKLREAQANAKLLDNPYDLQTVLAQRPTSGTTSGGIALDAALLSGNTAARSKFGEVKEAAKGLTGKLETSQSAANTSIQDAINRQKGYQDVATGRVSGAQENIRTGAQQEIADKLAADKTKFAEAQAAAKAGNFSPLEQILGGGAAGRSAVPDLSLEEIYGKLNTPGSDVDLSEFLTGPESERIGYSTGDVLDEGEIAKYQEFGNILGKPDNFIQAARNPDDIGFDKAAALERLQGIYGSQEAYRQQIAAAKAAEDARIAAAAKAAADKAEADRLAAEQAERDRLAMEERDRLAQLERDRLEQEERDRFDQFERDRLEQAERDRLEQEERDRYQPPDYTPIPPIDTDLPPIDYPIPDIPPIDIPDVPIEGEPPTPMEPFEPIDTDLPLLPEPEIPYIPPMDIPDVPIEGETPTPDPGLGLDGPYNPFDDEYALPPYDYPTEPPYIPPVDIPRIDIENPMFEPPTGKQPDDWPVIGDSKGMDAILSAISIATGEPILALIAKGASYLYDKWAKMTNEDKHEAERFKREAEREGADIKAQLEAQRLAEEEARIRALNDAVDRNNAEKKYEEDRAVERERLAEIDRQNQEALRNANLPPPDMPATPEPEVPMIDFPEAGPGVQVPGEPEPVVPGYEPPVSDSGSDAGWEDYADWAPGDSGSGGDTGDTGGYGGDSGGYGGDSGGYGGDSGGYGGDSGGYGGDSGGDGGWGGDSGGGGGDWSNWWEEQS